MSANYLNAALDSEMFKSQLREWSIQEKTMRRQLKEWYAEHGEGFHEFWHREDPPQTDNDDEEKETQSVNVLRTALIAIALDEVPGGMWGSFASLVCPEIAQLISLLELEDQTKWRNQVWDLFQVILAGQENTTERFNQDEIYSILKPTTPVSDQDSAYLKRPMFAVKSLAVARSCVLLQIFTTIAHCWLTILVDQSESIEGNDDLNEN